MSAALQPTERQTDTSIAAFEHEEAYRKAYIDVPFKLQANDVRWIPPLRSSTWAQLDRSYPWYQQGAARHFVIEGTGRVSAYYKPGSTTGYVGSFECRNDPAAAAGLLDRAVSWLKDQGAGVIRGPASFDTWHAYRFVVDDFASAPFLLEPFNPPHYPALWERYGFKPVASYVSMQQQHLPSAISALEPHHRRAVRCGFRFRPLDLGRFDSEIALLHGLSNRAFEGALGFAPISLDGFRRLYGGIQALLDPGLCVVAQDSEGSPVGFLFGYPDHSRAMKAMGGSSSLVAKVRFTLARRRPDTAILKTMAVLPQAQGTNVALAMAYLHHLHAAERGYRNVIHALMAQTNASLHMSRFTGATLLRRYALYEL